MPFLLWRTGWPPVVQILVWVVEEWAWNVYPSTTASSIAVVGVYASVLAGVWLNSGDEVEQVVATEKAEESEDTPAYERVASSVNEKKST